MRNFKTRHALVPPPGGVRRRATPRPCLKHAQSEHTAEIMWREPRTVCLVALLLAPLAGGCGRDGRAPTTDAPQADDVEARPRGEPPSGTLTNSIGMKLVRIPAGEFLMGAADDDPGGRDDERPPHRVRIT